MLNPIGQSNWILCTTGLGYACQHGVKDPIRSTYPKNSLAVELEDMGTELRVFLPGEDQEFIVDRHDTAGVDVYRTGKGYDRMICNICFVLKSEEAFQINQTDAKGRKTRRPSCNKCRQDIDRRSIPTLEKKEAKRLRPKDGTLWRCPICRKMGIVGVNVKVVADHDHYAGRWRGHLCDNCNTGLGRFKNGENLLMNAIRYVKDNEITE